MRVLASLALAAGLVSAAAAASPAREVCTLVIEAVSGETVFEAGDCITAVTPASTFKIPLALIGFDTGVLVDPQSPVMSFEPGDPDWGERWTDDTDPAHWMAHSVLWYSQRIARTLGAETLTAYARAFTYGNADFSGDPGADNGLERAWLSSSLTISPRAQAQFLLGLVGRTLPVSDAAYRNTFALIETVSAGDGWTLRGKTGGAYPRRADGSFDYAAGWGWYVGWAERGGQTLVFVRLDQDEGRLPGSPGLRARAALLESWPDLAGPWQASETR